MSFPGELWFLGLIPDAFKRGKETDKAVDGEELAGAIPSTNIYITKK